ncbi:hypothetical protein SAMN05421847_0139 [Halpernia humi]|uniref:Uncharacterized protein n=1 Tax=Halpernia humi TaxID=493375 RepID=A0A1H5SGY3_9FLAO|nr:hypothetical protein [Halpernia humi]SEF49684.1 hypothetical protein SAMN05421847_0139 [Halpernia humi]
MSQLLQLKRKLISEVYEKAKNNTAETSFSGILKDLELTLREDFNIQLSYKSFETYYKFLIEKDEDYNIKPLILNDLSEFLGFENFKNFCEKNPIPNQSSSVKVTIDGKQESSTSKNFSDIIINITNSPIFTFPEFVSRHKNSFGLVGILFILGFFAKKYDFFQDNEAIEQKKIIDSSKIKNATNEANKSTISIPQTIVYMPSSNNKTSKEKILITKKEKECMYWNGEKYIPVFCDENKAGFHIEQLDQDKLKLIKITQTDTLTAKNALGKVWYDKTSNKVEFFTHYGKNPENGKSLKEVTKYILEKYVK